MLFFIAMITIGHSSVNAHFFTVHRAPYHRERLVFDPPSRRARAMLSSPVLVRISVFVGVHAGFLLAILAFA
jgi:hypothetical protein